MNRKFKNSPEDFMDIYGRAATTEAMARRDAVLRLVGRECRAADLRHKIAKARRSHQATYSMSRELVRLTAELASGMRGRKT